MRNGDCAPFCKMWPSERGTFLTGQSGSEFWFGRDTCSILWVMRWTIGLLLSCESHYTTDPVFVFTRILVYGWRLISYFAFFFFFLLLGMAIVSFSWWKSIHTLFLNLLGKEKREGVRMYFYWSCSCTCTFNSSGAFTLLLISTIFFF